MKTKTFWIKKTCTKHKRKTAFRSASQSRRRNRFKDTYKLQLHITKYSNTNRPALCCN